MFWGLVSRVQVLKIGVPDMGFKAFTFQGEACICKFPLDCGSLHGGAVYGEIVSQPLLLASMWVFSCLPDIKESLS